MIFPFPHVLKQTFLAPSELYKYKCLSDGWSEDSLSRFSLSSKCSLDNWWIDLSNDADQLLNDDDDDDDDEEDDDEENDDDDEKMKFFKKSFFSIFSIFFQFCIFFNFFIFSLSLYSSRTLGMEKKYLLSIEGSILSWSYCIMYINKIGHKM